MKLFGATSIKRNLTTIIMFISGMALLIACSAFIVYDSVTFKNAMVRKVTTLANIAGLNSTAALVFNRADDAAETLAALRAEQNITAAFIYTERGELFAKYVRDDSLFREPQIRIEEAGHQFTQDRLLLTQPITLDGQVLGSIYIESDLVELDARLRRYAVMVLAVLSLSALVALVMASRFQRIISGPILHLAKTAERVSDQKDFSVRAKKKSRDELGFLTERFNEMLAQIEERESALRQASDKLKEQADQLSRELQERKRIEAKLRGSEERFRDLFDNAPDLYIILDSEGKITDFNKWGLSTLGYDREEMIGKPFTSLVYQSDLPKTEKLLSRIKKTSCAPKNIEFRMKTKDGQTIWVNEECSLSKNGEGAVQSVRLVCRDITDRKRLQNELERAQRLEAAGRMAGQIAHDFNNLLGPLAAYPSLIREDLKPNHPLLDLVDEMALAARKIADINQQLLALGRRGHYKMEAIDVNELIENIIVTTPLPKDLQVIQELDKNLFMVKGGSAQLMRALINLIKNAVEAIEGPGVLKVKTTNVYLDKALNGYQTVQRGEYVQIQISDTGSGIKPEHYDRIFDPFFTTKTMDRIRGSGLGLSVVHGIVADHKGYLTVESRPGEGSTFTLYLPVSRQAELESSKRTQKIRGGHEAILIVDDDPMQRRVASQLLRRLGYRIHTVPSGEQAIDFIRKVPQDLIILDMVMDGIDGTETYQRILKIKPEQKAIVLSGYARSKRVEKALHLGAGTFVHKPVSLDDLAVAVRQELDKK